MGITAAIFDMDDTLHKGNTGWKFLRVLRKHRGVGLNMVFSFVFAYLQHKNDKLDFHEFLEKSSTYLEGIAVQYYRDLAKEAFEKYYRKRLYVNAIKQIEWHRKQGHHIVIATTSIKDTMLPIAEYLKVDHVIALDMEHDGSYYNGKPKKPYCYGPGKRDNVLMYVKDADIDLSKSYFYTDAVLDITMLEVIGHPIAINPERKLKHHAVKNGWQIVKYKEVLGNRTRDDILAEINN